MLGVLVLAAILFPVFATSREGSRRSCISNAKQVGNALQMYTQDYDERLPPIAGWENNLQPYLKNLSVYKCPNRRGVFPAYAYNQLLDLLPLKQVQNARQTPAFFESSLGTPDASDRLESFVIPHGSSEVKQGNIVFVDGHAQALSAAPKANAGLMIKPVGKPFGNGRR